LQATLAGLGAIDASVTEVAKGMGMSRGQRLRKVELPLAAPVILAGVRTSVIINIGTATIASTVGASTLGTPIIIGLSGFNTAHVIQGALLVDRKSTRLNSSHVSNSYAVFCLKKKR